ncbi:hypothetical protein SAMN03080594_102148 [Arenibacter palladensis]|uniref:Uncharacterized protein n=1 Tax=Arenibacter palladensis TaxID=237373 RepID=A0A1M4XPN6_9FLAO|nr:hypothetical protein SAMN03080594_102148 [Arenibacter palladensis]
MNRIFKLSIFSILFVFVIPSDLLGQMFNLSGANIISLERKVPKFPRFGL